MYVLRKETRIEPMYLYPVHYFGRIFKGTTHIQICYLHFWCMFNYVSIHMLDTWGIKKLLKMHFSLYGQCSSSLSY